MAGRSPEIWPYMPIPVTTIDDMRRLVEEALRARERGTELPFVIEDQDIARIVGSTRFLEIPPAHRGVEIGWPWLSPRCGERP